MACSRVFGERPENLGLARYLVAVSDLIPPPSGLPAASLPGASDASAGVSSGAEAGPLWEAGQLCAVLSVVQHESAALLLEEAWVDGFQRHCARVLVAGVNNGFVRIGAWTELLARLGRTGRACPHLAAAICWALAHPSRPFGSGTNLRVVCGLWVVLVRSCPGWTGGRGASAASSALRALKLTPDGCDPSTIAKMLDPKVLEQCAVAGRELGMDMMRVEEWPVILQGL